jgi:hypothetical protein
MVCLVMSMMDIHLFSLNCIIRWNPRGAHLTRPANGMLYDTGHRASATHMVMISSSLIHGL